jgi:gliding motility-associated-like protein
MLKKIALLLLLAASITGYVAAQCIPLNITPNTYNLPCGINCTNISLKVPDIRQTTDYVIKNIPYTPYAYTTPTGNEVGSIYIDDQYSAALPSPFPICFYGSTFNQFIIGSNGVVSFDLNYAGCKNAYVVPNPIPFEGTLDCNATGTAHYPKYGIFSPYYDIDPSVTATSPNRKIEWRVEGIAPCRRLIVSFSKIPLYTNFGGTCNDSLATQQVVIHEATGIVDVFIENKPTCTSWESGRGILGIQKDATTALAVPGKNAVSWTEQNTGYQFFPSGGASQLQAVQLIKNGSFVATGTIGASANGEINVDFSNYCATTNRDTLEVRAIYRNCADPNEVIYGTGTIYIVKNPGDLLATATPVAAICTTSNGSITVNVPPGAGTPPYEYQINGGLFQSGNTFTGLASGTYTVFVKDAGVCSTTLTVLVNIQNPLLVTPVTANTSCTGVNNGSITVNTSNGTGPYQYSINGGAPQPGNVFTGLAPGSYTVTVTDGNGCSRTAFAVVNNGPGIVANVIPTAATCPGATNGVITITPLNGTAPYQYQLNAGALQPGNTFTGLASGLYNVTVRDANGCTTTYNNVNVAAGPGITATSATTPASCSGASNGTITVNPTSGSAPYQYQLNAGAFQPLNNFTGLAAGPYTVIVRDANNCTGTFNITVPSASGVAATATTAATTCAAATNGTITVNVSAGTAPYQYSLDAGANQPLNIFTGVTAGLHSVRVTDAAGCFVNIPVTVAAGAGITASAATVPTSCNGAVNGSITITPASGTAPYQYQLDGGTLQPLNTFTNVAAGPHSVLVRDANNCTVLVNMTVAAGANLTGTTIINHVQCNGDNTGSVTITPTNGNAPYQFSINGGAFQNSAAFTGLTAGNYTIQLRDGNNCSGSIAVTVNQPTTVTINAVSAPALCNGQANGTITITGGGGTPPLQYSINGVSYVPTNVFSTIAGNYTVYVRDANNCIKSTTITVTQPATLQVTATTANATCNGGNNGLITVTTTGGNGGIQYSIDGTNFQPGNTFNTAPGPFTITVKDANNCTATTNVNVGLTDDLLLATRADTTLCESKSVTLATTSNATTFAWAPQTGLSDPNAMSPVATPASTTQYTVTATYGRCTRTDNVVVNINPAPIPDAGPGITICFGKDYQLQGSGGTEFFWRPASLLSNANIANPVANPRNTTVFFLKVRDANGCESLTEDTVKVIVTPPIVAYAGPDTTIIYGVPYQLNVTSQNVLPPGTSYLWTPSTGLNNANIANPQATIFADQLYSVEITTPEGCKGSASVKLKTYKGPEIYVPTGFTPNGDGQNDVFRVVPVGIKFFDYLRIYNRWGQLVFETSLATNGWEGRFKAQDQPMGTYIYTVRGRTETGRVIFKKGSLLLIR